MTDTNSHQEKKNYEHVSHKHCWNQKGSPACGIPLERHTQCCLCDLKVLQGEELLGVDMGKEDMTTEVYGLVKDGKVHITRVKHVHPTPTREEATGKESLQVQGWEEEFDEAFPKSEGLFNSRSGWRMIADPKEVKSFIRTLLKDEKSKSYAEEQSDSMSYGSDLLERVTGNGALNHPSVPDKVDDVPEDAWINGWFECLEAVRSLITNLKKE